MKFDVVIVVTTAMSLMKPGINPAQQTLFNANANRCFEVNSSPTTTSPTKPPTFPPTLTPSSSFPTTLCLMMLRVLQLVIMYSLIVSAKMILHTLSTLIYIQDPEKKTKTCGWLTANRNKTEKRIARGYCTKDFDDGALINSCVKSYSLC
ncbi:predicted protein [Chaetoceros tenuissimus]|uniref:Uncharacterized protein n=1 Tax=Chaetoceros tenuissimus TaxID=426638 RepID=A0AAD3HAV7_9STRA|nr:predicted protein [Chaetoceros tenuissimus]